MYKSLLTALLLISISSLAQTVKKDTLAPVITAGKDTIITIRTTTTIAAVTIPSYSIVSENSIVKPLRSSAPPVNTAPTARAGADQSITLPTSQTALSGTASTDSDGQISAYGWQKILGTGGAITSPGSSQTTVTGLTAGLYSYRLTVTDNAGASSFDDVNVQVNPAPSGGTTYPLSFTPIPFTDPDLNAPARGVEQWHNANEINVPVEGTNTQRLDVYYRFVWTKLEGRTQGSYNWAYFDGLVNSAIQKRQKMSFGIMSVFPGNEVEAGGQSYTNGGGWGCYPEYVHNLMQSEPVKDFLVNGTWTPNYNSLNYYNRLLAMHQALDAHINSTSFNGIRYKDVINFIDIRAYGAWGEWHSGYLPNNNVLLDYPAGTFPTDQGFKRLVDAHTLGFPNTQLVAMIAAFDAHFLQNTWNSPYVADYILNVAKNNVGPIGWRRDQWGALDSYLDAYLVNNNRNYNGGQPFSVPIMARYKTSPITGEPPNWNPNDYADLERQIRLYHASSFGNGNYGTFSYNDVFKSNIRAASKAAGYRLIITSGQVVTTASSMKIELYWQNTGIAPIYEHWNVVFELVAASGNVAWSTISAFKPRLFLPQATAQLVSETVPVSVPAGTYTLRLAIKDPVNYRGFLPLALQNRNPDNSINLKTGIVF